ncbi:LamG-like jellyroll fold domain-containing protein [Sulfuriroseicoccus oceanibius]|uniref:LamG-like jellyroll fold domain-containing protein n=1 Tax=Sulfuriroseicoccus oceanibius TaxID=2707525 RepID=UPI001F333243|nr:LamG-like jellyroll fold domain-containing protein [Sulfuriroseicoccus oceanibius]
MTKMKHIGSALAIAAAALTTSQAALTAHWDFNTDGVVVDNVSTTAGTLLDGATVSGGNANFVGGTSRIDTGINGGLGGTGSFTVLAFFQTSSATNQTIFDFSPTTGGVSGADLRLFAQGNGNVRIEMSAGSGFEANLGGTSVVDGNTHMIAAVFNSSTGDSFQDVDLYVDGVLYDVTGGNDGLVNLGDAGKTVFLGSIGHLTSERPFVGSMGEVAIYDTALTLTELDDVRVNGVAAVPEPSSAALLGLGGLAMILRRRK